MGVNREEGWSYQQRTEEAARRARETGHVDLCDLAEAAAAGFSADTFMGDVLSLAAEED